MSEREVLLEQLDELLAMGVEDEDDALEVAVVAGLAHRLGVEQPLLADAVDWRDGPGADLVEEAWLALDLDPLTEAVDGVLEGDADEGLVEEALFELDDVVAAAIWTDHREVVADAAVELAQTIRQVPEPFAFLADYAKEVLELPAVAQEPQLYDYWKALAEAGRWKDA